MKKIFALLALMAVFLLGCARDTTNDAFATCIANSGATFYGAFWCPHCSDQKKEFGDAKDLLPYVECDPNGKNADAGACTAAGVEQYPTWIFADGTKVTGVQSFEELAEATSCPLPGEESILLK
ncbi:hypothetical protein IPG41_01060 [Candidatus Peregrinibacteria bacterium]|nr:MAG: hypothetical protein IPG41_01060 [Candidatus Peregrinibacteria bacterium]